MNLWRSPDGSLGTLLNLASQHDRRPKEGPRKPPLAKVLPLRPPRPERCRGCGGPAELGLCLSGRHSD